MKQAISVSNTIPPPILAKFVVTASLDWLQTLSDSTRVRLLILLDGQELSVSELCSVVQLPQSTVSRHLRTLAEEEWVESRREGTTNMYFTNASRWCNSRSELWQWVQRQADSPSIDLDQQRLAAILEERSRSEMFFSSAAEQWDNLRVELFGQQLDAFILAATLPPNSVVGELGCGSAPLSQLVAPFVKQVIAVDSSSAMLNAATEKLRGFQNVELYQSQLAELPLAESSLDAAWLTVVLPFLPDPAEVFRECQRVLSPDASLVIVDLLPHERKSYQQEMGHLRLGCQQSELEAWLAEAGLQLKSYHSLPPDPQAKGPALFAAVATKSSRRNGRH